MNKPPIPNRNKQPKPLDLSKLEVTEGEVLMGGVGDCGRGRLSGRREDVVYADRVTRVASTSISSTLLGKGSPRVPIAGGEDGGVLPSGGGGGRV